MSLVGTFKDTSKEKRKNETALKLSEDCRSVFSTGRSEDTYEKEIETLSKYEKEIETLSKVSRGHQPTLYVVRPEDTHDNEITSYSPAKHFGSKSKV